MNSVRKMSFVTIITFAISLLGIMLCKFLQSDAFMELVWQMGLDVDYGDMMYVLGVAEPMLGLLVVVAEFSLFTMWLCAEKRSPMVFIPIIGLMTTTGCSIAFRMVSLAPRMFPPTELPAEFYQAYGIVWSLTMILALAALIWLGIMMLPRGKFFGIMLFVAAFEVALELLLSRFAFSLDYDVSKAISIASQVFYWAVWITLYLSMMLSYRTKEESKVVLE